MKSIAKKVEKAEPKPTPKPKDTFELSCSETEGGKWVSCGYAIYQDEEGKKGKHIAGYRSYKNKIAKGQLSVGKYILKSTYNKFKKETPFEIKAGEITKLHIIFTQFSIGAKCNDINTKVNYEIYAKSGRMVYEKKLVCSKSFQISLDEGDYSVEAKTKNGSKEEQFTVGGDSSKLIIDMTTIEK
jgi:hypothetical protein